MGRAKVSLWLPPMVEPLGLGGSWIKINQYLCGYAMGTFSIRSRHFGLFFIDYPGCNNNCFSVKIAFYVDLPSYKKNGIILLWETLGLYICHLISIQRSSSTHFLRQSTFFINKLYATLSQLRVTLVFGLVIFHIFKYVSSTNFSVLSIKDFQFCFLVNLDSRFWISLLWASHNWTN